jgi:hypothetical protein
MIPKSQSNYLRYREENLVPLCQEHHFAHHTKGDPMVEAEIIRKKGFEWYDGIETKRHQICKVNREWYLSIIKELG